jgi:hypothetical protein
MTRLEELAIRVAIEAPSRQPRHSFAARIPWSTVEAIRAELEQRNVDWRTMAERVEELERENRARHEAERRAAFARRQRGAKS